MKKLTKQQLDAYQQSIIYAGTRPRSDYHGNCGRYWSVRDAVRRLMKMMGL